MSHDINAVLHHKRCDCPICKSVTPLDTLVKNTDNRYVCIDCFVDENIMLLKEDYAQDKHSNTTIKTTRPKWLRCIIG